MAKHVEPLLNIILSSDYRNLVDEHDGKPVVPKNEIYEIISTRLNNNIKPKY